MKRPRITTLSYERVVSSDNMVTERDNRIQVYNCKKYLVYDDTIKSAKLVTL